MDMCRRIELSEEADLVRVRVGGRGGWGGVGLGVCGVREKARASARTWVRARAWARARVSGLGLWRTTP